jgi:hypothetical protein
MKPLNSKPTIGVSRSSLCTCQTDLVQSNFNRLMPLELTSASPDMHVAASVAIVMLKWLSAFA